MAPHERLPEILAAGALRYRAWAQSWSSAALAARSVLPSNRPATPLFSPACWEPGLYNFIVPLRAYYRPRRELNPIVLLLDNK